MLLIAGIIALAAMGLLQPVFAQGYEINGEQAGQLVDDLKDQGIPLAKQGFNFAHSVIYRIVSIFLPEHPMITPELVNTITIILTIIGIFGIAMKMGSHMQKVILIVMLLGIMAFFLWPAGA